MRNDLVPIKIDAVISSALVSMPVWNYYLQCINEIASLIAAICGAIVGTHAVYRLWKKHRSE